MEVETDKKRLDLGKARKKQQPRGDFNQLIRHVCLFSSAESEVAMEKTLFGRGSELRSKKPLYHNVLLKPAKNAVF